MSLRKRRPLTIAGVSVRSGETRDIHLPLSQRYTGDFVNLPIRVIRARRPGPRVFVTAAVHGDELNGVGIIHELMFGAPWTLERGAMLLVPTLNIFGFEAQSRYMPDRRDLNRCFPGSATGSLTSRFAHVVSQRIVAQCDYGIDLHTAASGRTNFPNVRCDLNVPAVRTLARAFGCELMVNGKGPDGALRREATKAGCPTIILEAGETNKIEPRVLEVGLRGIRNVLIELDMLEGEAIRPAYQVRVNRSTWVRSEVGGLLRFHVTPGETVTAGQPVATNASVFGKEQSVLRAPVDGIVLGMTTLPAVKPGEPVCHIAIPNTSLRAVRKALSRVSDDSIHQRVRDDLATNVSVSEREAELENWLESDDDA